MDCPMKMGYAAPRYLINTCMLSRCFRWADRGGGSEERQETQCIRMRVEKYGPTHNTSKQGCGEKIPESVQRTRALRDTTNANSSCARKCRIGRAIRTEPVDIYKLLIPVRIGYVHVSSRRCKASEARQSIAHRPWATHRP